MSSIIFDPKPTPPQQPHVNEEPNLPFADEALDSSGVSSAVRRNRASKKEVDAKGKIVKGAARAAIALLATGAVGLGANALYPDGDGGRAKIEQEALKGDQKVKDAFNGVMVFGPGTAYRESPVMIDDDEDTTVAGRVPEGQVLFVNRPGEWTDDTLQRDGWIGFRISNNDATVDGGADNPNYYWINMSELERQDKAVERHPHSGEASLPVLYDEQDLPYVATADGRSDTAMMAEVIPADRLQSQLDLEFQPE